MNRLAMLFVPLVALVLLAGCGAGAPTATLGPAVPTRTPAPTAMPTVSPTPYAGLEVLGYLDYYHLPNGVTIVGLLRNNSNVAVGNIKVSAEVFDRSPTLIGTGSDSWLYLAVLEPQATIPFAARVDVLRGKMSTFTITADALPVADIATTGAGPRLADKLNVGAANLGRGAGTDGRGNRVTGSVTNNGELPVNMLGVLAAGFDADGNFRAAGRGTFSVAQVASGETREFQIDMEPPNTSVTRVETFPLGIEIDR